MTYRNALMVGMLAACLLTSPAQAQEAVIDMSAISKIQEQLKQAKEDFANQVEQLKKATETLEEVNKVREGVEEVGDAIGEVASFRIPIPNAEKMLSRFKSDLACIIPNRPGYGFLFEDFVQASFCDLTTKYRESLFATVEDWTGLSLSERQQKLQEVKKNRISLLADTTTQALANSDVVINKTPEILKGIDDLDLANSTAKTLQKKTAVNNELLLILNRQQADTNRLIAHMAKNQAAMFVLLGLKSTDIKTEDDKKEGTKTDGSKKEGTK